MERYFNCLLVGDWGSGKTTAASTAPKPVLYLDVDNKLHKMENLRPKLESGDLIQWPITESLSKAGLRERALLNPKPGQKLVQQRPMGYLQLADMIDKLRDSKCIVDGRKIGTVVLDSYTSTDEHIRRLLMATNNTNTMTRPLYGVLLVNFEDINDNLLKALPCNIIIICHKKVIKDDLSGKITYEPLINGQMSGKIGKDFEEVYAMEKKVLGDKATYEMNTIGSDMLACRTSRNLPARVEADFSKIYK